MITRIDAYRYRCFSDNGVNVQFGRYNVIAGRNGSGKTTLLDIPVLLGDLIRSRYCADAFLEAQANWESPRAQTLHELFFKEDSTQCTIAVEAKLPDEVVGRLVAASSANIQGDASRWTKFLRYEIRLELYSGKHLQVRDENLFLFSEHQRTKSGRRQEGLLGTPIDSFNPKARGPRTLRDSNWVSVVARSDGDPTTFSQETERGSGSPKRPSLQMSVPANQVAMAVLPPDHSLYPAANWFRNVLEQESVFLDPKWNALRTAAPPAATPRIRSNGGTMPWLALDLWNHDRERFLDWVEHVKTGLPNIRTIEANEREEDHHAYFAVTYDNDYKVTSSGLSEGTLRLIALTLIPYLQSEILPSHLVVEQPEDGIHPQAIETILDSLQSVYASQVWISTQSPIVLAHSEIEHVICATIEKDGSASMINGPNHPRLQQWMGTLDLGTLLAAGVLG
jgi:hypothetical protein